MNRKNAGFPADRTERQRRKGLSEEEVKELERAGGAEGGMQAGSAGGPGDPEKPPSDKLQRSGAFEQRSRR